MTLLAPSRTLRHRKYGCCLLLGVLAILSQVALARGQDAKQMPTPAPVIPKMPSAPEVAGAEVDRVVATVNGDLILDSDVNEELRFDVLRVSQSSSLPAGGSAAQLRDKAIERLIDRDLILQQIRLQPQYSPSDDAVTKDIEDLRKTIPACAEYHCDTHSGWDSYLASEGFTEATFREEWIERMKVLAFTEQRFKMGIRISQAQIKDYYEKTLLPQYAERHAKPAPLDKVSDRIQALLLEQQVTSLLNDWLQSLRAQGNVVVMHPGDTP
jgi:peptidyl-prolyl cis-trans isomerase SurA